MLRAVGFEKRVLVLVITYISLALPQLLVAQANTECITALPLTTSVLDFNDWQTLLLDGSMSETACSVQAEGDVWFSFVASSGNDIIEARSIGWVSDIAIEIRTDCDGASVIGCFDNYSSTQIERVIPGGLTVGDTYYFRVYDASGANPTSEFKVQVRTFMDGGLNPNYCEVYDYQLSNSIYAERDDLGQLYQTNIPVNGYRFKFVNVNTGAVQFYAQPTLIPYMQLYNVGALEHGEVYDVSVAHRVQFQANGTSINAWSEFGTSCEIGIDSVLPTTRLVNSLCPAMNDLDFQSWIGAISVLGVDEYQFRFEGNDQVVLRNQPGYGFSLSELGTDESGLSYGSAVYEVTVRLRINDKWSEEGETCFIGMVAHPGPTKLNPSYCGGTYFYGAPNFLLAQNIYGATSYEFRFTPSNGSSAPINEITSGLALPFHMTSNEFTTGFYDVHVRAFAGGEWGDFFEGCQIFIDAGPQIGDYSPSDTKLASQDIDMQYNSLAKVLSIDSKNMSSPSVDIQVLDLSGKLIHEQSSKLSTESHSLQIPLDVPQNTYVIVLIGQNDFASKVIDIRD